MAPVTYLEAIRIALQEEMDRDPSVFLLGEDIGAYGGAFKVTEGLLEKYGNTRVIDTPIAEAGIVGAAIGAALSGMRPVVEMQFADFISNTYNMLVNFAAKVHYRMGLGVPLVVRAPTGGGVHAGPFHSQNPEVPFVHCPGLKVVAPSTPGDARGLLKAAIRDNNPVIYLEHKLLYRRVKEELPPGDGVIPLGLANRVREGGHLSIVTYGAMVGRAGAVADRLAEEGYQIEIIDLRSLLPMDMDTVATSVRKTGRVMVLHEDTLTAGLGGEISASISQNLFEYLDAPVMRVASLDTPVPYGVLEDPFLPSEERILHTAKSLLAY